MTLLRRTTITAMLAIATILTACGPSQVTSNYAADSISISRSDSSHSTENVAMGSEENSEQEKEDHSARYAQFIPDGYEELGSAEGDLNRDAYPDAVLILKMAGEADIPDPYENPAKRPLLLLLGQPDGSLRQAARNDNVVLCAACGGVFGDPFNGITIKNGFFSIEHYGGSNWRWTRIITFKWSESERQWFLHRDGGVSYHTSDPDKMEEEVKTVKDFGIVPFEQYSSEE